MYNHVLTCVTMYYQVLPCIAMYNHVLGYIAIYYILKQWIVFSRALIGYSKSGCPVLFTVSPPIPPSERRQTRVTYEQNA